jgi:nitric oxide reductase subunit C
MKGLLRASVVLAVAAGLSVPVLAGDAAAGAEAYKANKCSMCHQIGGQGGKMGGALDDVGTKRDADWLKKYIKDPKSVDPKAKMKAFPTISDKDLDDLVAYLLTLKAEPKK